jgi:hypothetical protein
MIGNQQVFDAVMGQKTAGFAGVFSRNQINPLQNAESPKGNVIPVTDRSGDNIQFSLLEDMVRVMHRLNQKHF